MDRLASATTTLAKPALAADSDLIGGRGERRPGMIFDDLVKDLEIAVGHLSERKFSLGIGRGGCREGSAQIAIARQKTEGGGQCLDIGWRDEKAGLQVAYEFRQRRDLARQYWSSAAHRFGGHIAEGFFICRINEKIGGLVIASQSTWRSCIRAIMHRNRAKGLAGLSMADHDDVDGGLGWLLRQPHQRPKKCLKILRRTFKSEIGDNQADRTV